MADSKSDAQGVIQSSDYKFNALNIVTSDGSVVDVTKLMLELDLYEDLYSPCMTGQIKLGEALDLISSFKMHGNEFLQVSIDKPSLNKPLVKTFRIYKCSERTLGSNGLQNYTLSFCSEEFFISSQILVSKSYKGMTIDAMVTDLLLNKLSTAQSKVNVIEPTTGVLDIIIPRMQPLEAIQWLCPRSFGPNKNLYLFYENRDGYNFVSYETLLTQQPYDTYHYNIKTTTAPEKNSNTFNVLAVAEDYNLLKAMSAGAFSSSVSTFDIISRQFRNDNFSSKQLSNNAILNTNLPANDFANRLGLTVFTAQENILKYVISTDSDPNVNPSKLRNWLPQTASRLGQLNTFKMMGVIPGDILMRVGAVINVNVPKMQIQDKTTANDQLRSGRFLVSSVHHKFILDISSTIIEMLSDSVSTELNAPAVGSATMQQVISA
jgi:hypothetical protein